MEKKGYWFNTETLEKIDVTYSTHIRSVTNSPHKFSLTRDRVEEEYAKHKELIPIEGKARLALIIWIIQNTHWVRIREYDSNQGHWVTVNYREENQKKIVEDSFDFDPKLYNFSRIQ